MCRQSIDSCHSIVCVPHASIVGIELVHVGANDVLEEFTRRHWCPPGFMPSAVDQFAPTMATDMQMKRQASAARLHGFEAKSGTPLRANLWVQQERLS
jgi:hypothetical protein